MVIDLQLTAEEASVLRRLLLQQLLKRQVGAEDRLTDPAVTRADTTLITNVLRRLNRLRNADPHDITDDLATRSAAVVASGEVEIDLRLRLVRKRGATINLTKTEWLLLEALAMNAGRVISSEELLQGIWGPKYVDEAHYLPVWISRIRKKLEAPDQMAAIIKTVHGRGYMIDGVVLPDEQEDSFVTIEPERRRTPAGLRSSSNSA